MDLVALYLSCNGWWPSLKSFDRIFNKSYAIIRRNMSSILYINDYCFNNVVKNFAYSKFYLLKE